MRHLFESKHMSYIKHSNNFSGGIVELNPLEIEEIAGGPVFLIGVAYFGIGLSAGVLVGGSAFVAGLYASQH